MKLVTGIVLFLLLGAFCPASALGQEEEDAECMDCHDDRSLVTQRDGRRLSLFVNYRAFARSAHGDEGCISCHADVDVEDLPHEDRLAPVQQVLQFRL